MTTRTAPGVGSFLSPTPADLSTGVLRGPKYLDQPCAGDHPADLPAADSAQSEYLLAPPAVLL